MSEPPSPRDLNDQELQTPKIPPQEAVKKDNINNQDHQKQKQQNNGQKNQDDGLQEKVVQLNEDNDKKIQNIQDDNQQSDKQVSQNILPVQITQQPSKQKPTNEQNTQNILNQVSQNTQSQPQKAQVDEKPAQVQVKVQDITQNKQKQAVANENQLSQKEIIQITQKLNQQAPQIVVIQVKDPEEDVSIQNQSNNNADPQQKQPENINTQGQNKDLNVQNTQQKQQIQKILNENVEKIQEIIVNTQNIQNNQNKIEEEHQNLQKDGQKQKPTQSTPQIVSQQETKQVKQPQTTIHEQKNNQNKPQNKQQDEQFGQFEQQPTPVHNTAQPPKKYEQKLQSFIDSLPDYSSLVRS